MLSELRRVDGEVDLQSSGGPRVRRGDIRRSNRGCHQSERQHSQAQVRDTYTYQRPPGFIYREKKGTRSNPVLHCEKRALQDLAERFGTPLYVYSASMIRERIRAFADAFRGIDHTICYSVKANSNLGILRLLAKLGCGFDVVSSGELQRVLRAS